MTTTNFVFLLITFDFFTRYGIDCSAKFVQLQPHFVLTHKLWYIIVLKYVEIEMKD